MKPIPNSQNPVRGVASLPPVAEMMRAVGLEPKKSLGQNFLFDLNLTGKIARAVPDIENTVVIEVGPGPGGLTRALLAAGARKVIAIEKDKTTKPILREIQVASDGRLEIIFGDALKFPSFGGVDCEHSEQDGVVYPSFQSFVNHPTAFGGTPPKEGNFAICSNLPYNIGTELLIRWLHVMSEQRLTPHASRLTSMTLMFQREVAERIVAHPGDSGYGRLSVLTALVANAKILFDVPNTAFVPRPKVQSAVVQIIPKIAGRTNLQKIEKLTALLFGQRRKMIRGIMPGTDWTRFGLTGVERAEELNPEKFAEIAAEIVI